MGDSLVKGLQPPLEKLSAAALTPMDSVQRDGSTITGWEPEAGNIDPSTRLVLVSLGSNDQALSDPTFEIPLARRMVEKLQKYGAKVLWIVPPVLVLKSTPQAGAVASAILHSGADYLFPPDTGDGETLALEMQSDKIHPTGKGYQTWADYVWRYITTGQRQTFPKAALAPSRRPAGRASARLEPVRRRCEKVRDSDLEHARHHVKLREAKVPLSGFVSCGLPLRDPQKGRKLGLREASSAPQLGDSAADRPQKGLFSIHQAGSSAGDSASNMPGAMRISD